MELTGTSSKGMLPMSGKSFVNILKSSKSGIVDQTKKYVFSGRERHSSSRWNNLGYPQRAIRSLQYLLIWNMRPDLWPAGDPRALDPKTGKLLPMYGIDEKGVFHSEWAFADVDDAPSKSFLVENRKKYPQLFELSYGKRPEFELYDIQKDPFCFTNLYGNNEFAVVRQEMKTALLNELEKSGDPRVVGPVKDIFETYERYSPIRKFPKPSDLN
jgi:uncharacterized sulfatase